jgi:hypothetical protein
MVWDENQTSELVVHKWFFSVSNTRGNIRTANMTLNNIEMHAAKHNEKIKAWNDTMSAQLKSLRDKIAQAKHAAEGVS